MPLLYWLLMHGVILCTLWHKDAFYASGNVLNVKYSFHKYNTYTIMIVNYSKCSVLTSTMQTQSLLQWYNLNKFSEYIKEADPHNRNKTKAYVLKLLHSNPIFCTVFNGNKKLIFQLDKYLNSDLSLLVRHMITTFWNKYSILLPCVS